MPDETTAAQTTDPTHEDATGAPSSTSEATTQPPQGDEPKPPTISWDHAEPHYRVARLRLAILALAEHAGADVREIIAQLLD